MMQHRIFHTYMYFKRFGYSVYVAIFNALDISIYFPDALKLLIFSVFELYLLFRKEEKEKIKILKKIVK